VIKQITRKIAKGLNLNGPFNIQYLAKENNVKVIECNARASRSFPFISKVSKKDLAQISCKVLNNEPISKIHFDASDLGYVGVKASMFSFQRLDGADPVSGVEMASTGEVGCLGKVFNHALLLAMQSTQIRKPKKGALLSTGREKDKVKFMQVLDNLYKLNIPIYATPGTAKYLHKHGYEANIVHWIKGGDGPKAVDIIKQGKVDLVINVKKNFEVDEFQNNALIRKTAVRYGVCLLTNAQKAIAYLRAYDSYDELEHLEKLIHL
jgi:carbamoyl-phosphate synthase large subunit